MRNKISILLGQAVRNAREGKRITQQSLSEEVNISRNYISDIECGRYIPSVEKLIILANQLEIDLNILINDGNTI